MAKRALGIALQLRSAAFVAASDTTIVQIDAIAARNCISASQQQIHPTPLHTLALLHLQAPVTFAVARIIFVALNPLVVK